MLLASLALAAPIDRTCPDGHRYALYLPAGYSDDRDWPVLVVLDPRGRAEPVLEPFEAAADRAGLVVASSYDSRSDGVGADPTPEAVRAILDDLPVRIAPGSVILAGQSGTARTAWSLGELAPQLVAAVIGVGGATGDGAPPADPPPFAWVGSAGTLDFNWQEVRRADGAIRARGGASVFVPYEGDHGWPDAPIVDRLVAEAVVLGASRGRWTVDPESARIAALPPTVDVDPAEQDREAAWEDRFRARLGRVEQELSSGSPSTGRSLAELGAARLDRRGDAGARALALARGTLGFYLPRDLQARGDLQGWARTLEVATALGARGPDVWYDLACARSLTGRTDAALDALASAVDAGYADRAWAEQDPDLAPLRPDPRFAAQLARMR